METMQTPSTPAAQNPIPYDPVAIVLDRPRTLLFSWGAIRRIKAATGFDMRSPASGTPWDIDMLPVVLCEALRHEDPELTPEWVEEHLLEVRNAGYALERIFEAMGVDLDAVAASLEAEEGAAGEAPLPPKRGPSRRRS